MKPLLMAALLATAALLAAHVAAQDSAPLTPTSIVAAAPKSDWKPIEPADLLVMTLAPDTAGHPRMVVIQLIPPPFSQGWVGNIRTLAKAHWWDGTSVYRVVDNWVTQWGDGEDDPKKAKPLRAGIKVVPESEYMNLTLPDLGPVAIVNMGLRGPILASEWLQRLSRRNVDTAAFARWKSPIWGNDAYAHYATYWQGFPVAGDQYPDAGWTWPIHCYGSVGVARDLAGTGTGAELYAVIGTPPRQLDRNIAVVGRVIEGIENLAALPRGKGDAGVYDDPKLRVPILSVRLGTELPDAPRFEYLDTESPSFGHYAKLSASRDDPFYKVPAGGIDICNAKVPIRRVKP